MVPSTKHNYLRSIATKKLPVAVKKGAKKVANFAPSQPKHPAVSNFVKDQAGILAASRFNPELVAPAMGARAALEGVSISARTARHFSL